MLNRVMAAIGTLNTRMKDRHAYAAVLDLDDHMLRDIGVTRGDVRRLRAGHPAL